MTYAATAPLYPQASIWLQREPAYGVSQDAVRIGQAINKFTQHFFSPARWQNHIDALVEKLQELTESATNEALLGEDQSPVSLKALKEAELLIESIPTEIPYPEICIEPQGAIGFEWYRNQQNIFVLGMNGNGTIEYAAILGAGNEMHGKVNFAGEMPPAIQTLLKFFLSIPI